MSGFIVGPIPQHSMSICRVHFEVFCQTRTRRQINRQVSKKSIAMSVLDANRLAWRPQQQRRQINWCAAIDTDQKTRWTTNLSFFPPGKES
jgi:hypothetical protein